MGEYSKEYLSTHDIDWFCFINDKPIHAASNGGNLPDKINDREINSNNQIIAYKSDHIYSVNEVETNTEYIINKLRKSKREYSELELSKMVNNYLRTFIDMATRGFYSFDRVDDSESDEYYLIAWPKNNNKDFNVKLKNVFFKHDAFDLNDPKKTEPYRFNHLNE